MSRREWEQDKCGEKERCEKADYIREGHLPSTDAAPVPIVTTLDRDPGGTWCVNFYVFACTSQLCFVSSKKTSHSQRDECPIILEIGSGPDISGAHTPRRTDVTNELKPNKRLKDILGIPCVVSSRSRTYSF